MLLPEVPVFTYGVFGKDSKCGGKGQTQELADASCAKAAQTIKVITSRNQFVNMIAIQKLNFNLRM